MRIQRNNIERNILIALTLIGMTGLILGSIYDLDINMRLYSRGNIYPTFFRLFGEIPMVLFIVAFSINYLKINRNKNNVSIVLSIMALVLFPLISGMGIPKYFDIHSIYAKISMMILYFLFGYLISIKMKIENKDQFSIYALNVIIAVSIVVVLTEVMKLQWGRIRFNEMLKSGSFDKFTNWWTMNSNPHTDTFKSFPSGHTSAAASTLILMYLPRFYKFKKFEKLLIFLPVIWTILVYFSRILDGAHFLSDVSAGLLIATTVFLITDRKIVKIK